jgi:serine phosphatase RsbU (regulator of sigma subunit)
VLPVGEATAGGDFLLVESVGDKTIAFVGDVAGNGLDAAPYADRMCVELKQRIGTEDPAVLLEELNAVVHGDPTLDRLVTACAVVIDRHAWSAQWAFAGHLPPHWLDTGLPVDGATPALPMGVDVEIGAASASRRPLRPGEGMLLFTDGLEDVRGAGGDRFGSARITHALARRLHGASPERIVTELKDIACEFGEGDLADDLAVVAFRVM